MNPYKQTENWIRQTRPDIETPASMDSRILMDSYAAMNSDRSGQVQSDPHNLRRIFMKTPFKLTAAAAIGIIAVSAVFLFPTSPGSLALADVYNKVRQIQAFMYRMSATMAVSMTEGAPPQNMEMKTAVIVSTEYGVKMENTMHILEQDKTASQLMYILPAEKKMIRIVPAEKTYATMEVSDAQLEEMKRKNNDPREVIRQMLDGQYTDLGVSEIDGVKVQGFQAQTGDDAGNLTTTLWVDVKTWLPVRLEINVTMDKKMESHVVIDQFQWNVPATAADFEYTIPDDYTKVKM